MTGFAVNALCSSGGVVCSCSPHGLSCGWWLADRYHIRKLSLLAWFGELIPRGLQCPDSGSLYSPVMQLGTRSYYFGDLKHLVRSRDGSQLVVYGPSSHFMERLD